MFFAVLVSRRVVVVDSGTGPSHDIEHKSEQLEDCVAFAEGVVLDQLFAKGYFKFFEELRAEDELHCGISNTVDILL